MFNLEDCVAFITNSFSKKLTLSFESRLEYYNITKTQWMALYFVKNNHMITQRQLSDKLFLKEPTVARLLNQMELSGWLLRKQSEADKRIKLLSLTDAGKKLEAEILELAKMFIDDLTKNIPEKDLETYNLVVKKMLNNIETS